MISFLKISSVFNNSIFFFLCFFCFSSLTFYPFLSIYFSDFLQLSSIFYTPLSNVNNTRIDRNRHVNRIRNRSTMDSLGFEHDRNFRNRFGKLPHLQWPYRNTSMCIYGYVYVHVHNVAILWINNSTTATLFERKINNNFDFNFEIYLEEI